MSLESAVEKLIRQAIADGDFDNLKGRGKPLDLTDYFNTPEDMRMAYSLLKSNQFVPEEVDLINEIAALRVEIDAAADPEKRDNLTRKLNDRTLSLRLAIERRKR